MMNTEHLKQQKTTVYLEDLADALEETMEHWEQFLNVVTGEVVALSDGCYVEIDEELADEIEQSDAYVRLPNEYELDEYSIMQNFAEIEPKETNRKKLSNALHGRRPYRHFKDMCIELEIEEVYYAFRYLSFVAIAKNWCIEHEIPFQISKQ